MKMFVFDPVKPSRWELFGAMVVLASDVEEARRVALQTYGGNAILERYLSGNPEVHEVATALFFTSDGG